ncbi:Yip4p [Saccharomyces eubayanus]|uniref:Yip4p n=1 Tax=Saccharomyces eubayanus TaxID=1080349 RepID=UPI0006C441E2|nr:YIP4-like protein [Saccharomyces eubayanus]KOG99331.1 YIP4-like protein [Saccharomyces eubayanus]
MTSGFGHTGRERRARGESIKMSYGRDDTIIEPDFIEADTLMAAGAGSADEGLHDSASRGTLDETVLKTLKRDVVDINSRLKQVVYPHFPSLFRCWCDGLGAEDSGSSAADSDISANCDLWAPLAFIILYALFVSHAQSLFSSLFVSSWFILLVMALHLRLTKPHQKVSLISYISICGYCLFPQVLSALLSQVLLPLAFRIGGQNRWVVRVLSLLKLVVMALCLMWSVAAVAWVTKSKTAIEIYPLALCLFGMAWLSTIL